MISSKITIVNVVATATLDRPVKLSSLQQLFPQSITYDPGRYAAAYFKSNKMQGKVSIFSSGKMISVGTKNEEKAMQELSLVAGYLEKKGIGKLKGSPPKIRNIVATVDLGFPQRLDSIKPIDGIQIIYEPDQFPAAIITITLPEKLKATVLLFSSGKAVCVGLTDRKSIDITIDRLAKIIA